MLFCTDQYLLESTVDGHVFFRIIYRVKVISLDVISANRKKKCPYSLSLAKMCVTDDYHKVSRDHVFPWLKANYLETTKFEPRVACPVMQPKRCRANCWFLARRLLAHLQLGPEPIECMGIRYL